MKCIIVFKTKTGFTKRYANWLQEEIRCDLKSFKKVNRDELASYDVIIFGTYIRTGIIHGWKRMKRMVGEDNMSKLILFITGATPPLEEAQINAVWNRNLSKEYLEKMPHYYMQSGLNYEKMGVFDRLMMKTLQATMKRKKNKTEKDMEMIKRISRSYDMCSRKYIFPLLEHLKTME